VERVSRGEEFVITRHDAEIAQLVPAYRSPMPRSKADTCMKASV
jgi:antitoxin (DNA-binding transcriptional repressor) of toxin-antitoxin stability system